MADNGKIKFNLIHLIVIVCSVLFVIGLLLPARNITREPANRIKCSSNLRQIGLAMKMYANGETRTMSFPRTRWSPDTADRPTAFTRPSATQPFADDGPLPNDITAALFLVLRTQEITTDVFLCPQIVDAERFNIPAGKTIQSFSNFSAQNQLSYSMQNPYPTKAAYDAGFKWADDMNADFAIMADKNPGIGDILKVGFNDNGAEQRKVNSLNHQSDGQNVLYADGHVDWSASAWAGAGQNHIYGHDRVDPVATTQPASSPIVPIGIVGPPGHVFDTVLLPTSETKVP